MERCQYTQFPSLSPLTAFCYVQPRQNVAKCFLNGNFGVLNTLFWLRKSCNYGNWEGHSLYYFFVEFSEPDEIGINMCLTLQNLLNVQNKREHPNQVKEFVETVVPGGASIPLRRRCSSTTCLLNGSSCPAHASPSVSADCSEPTQECRSPACRVASRRGCPGDLCMTPRTC